MYNRLPEDEPVCLKHVEDIKHKINSLEENVFCWFILYNYITRHGGKIHKIYCMMLHLMYANISSINFYALYLMTYIYEAQSYCKELCLS